MLISRFENESENEPMKSKRRKDWCQEVLARMISKNIVPEPRYTNPLEVENISPRNAGVSLHGFGSR
jgi:hypothetical protein